MGDLVQKVIGTSLVVMGLTSMYLGSRNLESDYKSGKYSVDQYHITREANTGTSGLVTGFGAGLLVSSFFRKKDEKRQ